MTIGKFSIGKRTWGSNDFKWFYHPLNAENERKHFYFFVWVGYHWYICLEK